MVEKTECWSSKDVYVFFWSWMKQVRKEIWMNQRTEDIICYDICWRGTWTLTVDSDFTFNTPAVWFGSGAGKAPLLLWLQQYLQDTVIWTTGREGERESPIQPDPSCEWPHLHQDYMSRKILWHAVITTAHLTTHLCLFQKRVRHPHKSPSIPAYFLLFLHLFPSSLLQKPWKSHSVPAWLQVPWLAPFWPCFWSSHLLAFSWAEVEGSKGTATPAAGTP